MIEVIRGRVWDRPAPAGEGEFGTWYEACAEGRLLVQRCPACGHEQWYPRAVCTKCAATPEWKEVSGRGRIYTFTIIRQYHAKPYGAELPYAIAMVDLDDSPVRMFGTVTGVDVDTVRVGQPVEAYGVEFSPGRAMPYWRSA
jgi:uncharacterized OB-fold protein